MYMTAYSAGTENPKALHVDLMFTVESPKSMSFDAMTNVLVLIRTANVDKESSRRDCQYCIVEIR